MGTRPASEGDAGRGVPFEQFLQDAAAGTLPAVSFVDPAFVGEHVGTSADEHPHGDIRAGQAFLADVHPAVTTSPAWPRIVLVITYDEWGGFFDHVPPAVAPDARPDLGTGLRGFRVPCVVIGPRARRGHVAHGTYHHTSVLQLVEWRFGLAPVTVRDAAAANLAGVLDLTGRSPAAPIPPAPGERGIGPRGHSCPTRHPAGGTAGAIRGVVDGRVPPGEVRLEAPGSDGGTAREV